MASTTLPKGCEIVHFPGREQPYTVYIPGSVTYEPDGQRFVWRFCYTLGEALAVVQSATGWEHAATAEAHR